MPDNLKKITIPANGPGTHKEMAQRIKFDVFGKIDRNRVNGKDVDWLLERTLAIIKEYDIADAMRAIEGRDK